MPRVGITELMCILNVVISAIFVVTFLGYSIRIFPTVIRTRIRSYLCGCTSAIMREYETLCPTGILLRTKKLIVSVPFCTFPVNISVSRPNYFDSLFFQRSIFFFCFY